MSMKPQDCEHADESGVKVLPLEDERAGDTVPYVLPPSLGRRAWEDVLGRRQVYALLAERRWPELLERLHEARSRFRYDMELVRSVRLIELHLRRDG